MTTAKKRKRIRNILVIKSRDEFPAFLLLEIPTSVQSGVGILCVVFIHNILYIEFCAHIHS